MEGFEIQKGVQVGGMVAGEGDGTDLKIYSKESAAVERRVCLGQPFDLL